MRELLKKVLLLLLQAQMKKPRFTKVFINNHCITQLNIKKNVNNWPSFPFENTIFISQIC